MNKLGLVVFLTLLGAVSLFGLALCPAAADPAPPSLPAYLEKAMETWVPPAAQPEGEEAARSRYEAIAGDVAAVTAEEEPLYTGDEDRHRTGLLLLAIASYESSYFARVDADECLPKECDSGLAKTLWQVHFDRGIALDDDGWHYDRRGFHGRDAVRDRRLAIRIVLHLLRGPHDPRWNGGARSERAEGYADAHPFR